MEDVNMHVLGREARCDLELSPDEVPVFVLQCTLKWWDPQRWTQTNHHGRQEWYPAFQEIVQELSFRRPEYYSVLPLSSSRELIK